MTGARARFVTFEGGEGAGKSTQLEAVARCARATGVEVVTCREPGGTPLGERLRAALLGDGPATPLAELLVFNAARAELVETVVRPGLERDALVLCDRFADSTLAYQHFGRGLEGALVRRVNEAATGGLAPALTVLLDLPPAEGRARNGGAGDYLEREDPAFHERVRAGYLELARAEPQRWLVLDARTPVEVTTALIWERVRALLDR